MAEETVDQLDDGDGEGGDRQHEEHEPPLERLDPIVDVLVGGALGKVVLELVGDLLN